jgi:ribosome-associated heat shock protein Hsp15
MDSVRVDRWLCAARLFKSRTQAGDACSGGRVKLNERSVKPHQPVRVGDVIRSQLGDRLRVVEVLGLAEKRLSPALARELYEDHSPPPPPPEERGTDERGGRPTKRDRRALQRLKRGRS